MNRISIFIAALSLIFSCYIFFQIEKGNNRIAYVDVNKVIHGYKRTNLLKEEFENQKAELNTNKDSLFQAFKTTLVDFEKGKEGLSNEELVKKEKELEQKRVELNNYHKAIQQKLQQRDVENMNLLLEDINQFLKVYGEKEEYDLILGANGSGNIMYGESAIDITQKVIESLNQ